MVKLRRLTIHRFRQVRPGTTLEFADGFNLILGRNGTGKTTLLELLAAVWNANFWRFRDEELDVEWVLEARGASTRARYVQHDPDGPAQGVESAPLAPLPMVWFFEIEFSFSSDKQPLLHQVFGNGQVLQPGAPALVPHPRWTLPEHDVVERLSAGERYFWLFVVREHLRRQTEMTDGMVIGGLAVPNPAMPVMNLRFDEALDWLTWARGAVELLHVPAIARRGGHDPASSVGAAFPFVQASRGRFGAGDAQGGTSAGVVGLSDSTMPLLEAARQALSEGSVTCDLTLKHGDAVSATYRLNRIWVTRLDGARFDLEELSFGQQRMFAFLWYLACSPEVVIADELANGLHHEWILAAMKAIGERQAFLATQHPFLIDYLPGLDGAANLKRTFVLCSSVIEEGREVWAWRQMTDAEAHDVKEDLNIGIQSVNEVLSARGLW